MEFKDIRALIEKYDSIVIYRHINPDYDALGSQLGLKHLIVDNYPDKKVYAYGKEMLINPEYLEDMDDVDIETIRNSLTVTLDTSVNKRSDDITFLQGREILKIDHHLRSEYTGEYMYVDTDASSVCQIVAELAQSVSWEMGIKAAGYLYGGMLTDSCGLAIDKVDGKCLRLCAYLADSGIDIPWINRCVFDYDMDGFKAKVYFEERIKFDHDIAYLIGTLEDGRKWSLTDGEIKDYVDIMANIKGVNKYAVFAEMPDHQFTASLRSHKAPVVDIARKYGGGGHALACGIPMMSKDEVAEAIELLINTKE